MSAIKDGISITLKGIVLNIALLFIKGTAGILGNSYALIADAIESSSDIFTSIIVWIGLKTAAREPDEDHPYGHGKAEPIAAIVVSFILVMAAIIISIQAIHYILTPHQPPAPFTAIILLLVVIVKEWMYRKTQKVAGAINSTAVAADAWHHRSDAFTSFTALIGIIIAIVLGKGYESADDWAALIAACIIIANAFYIFKPALYELMDSAPPAELVAEVRKIANAVSQVEGLDKCLIRKMGIQYYVDIHIIVDENLTVREGHRIAHAVKDEVMKQLPQIADVLTHIEPSKQR